MKGHDAGAVVARCRELLRAGRASEAETSASDFLRSFNRENGSCREERCFMGGSAAFVELARDVSSPRTAVVTARLRARLGLLLSDPASALVCSHPGQQALKARLPCIFKPAFQHCISLNCLKTTIWRDRFRYSRPLVEITSFTSSCSSASCLAPSSLSPYPCPSIFLSVCMPDYLSVCLSVSRQDRFNGDRAQVATIILSTAYEIGRREVMHSSAMDLLATVQHALLYSERLLRVPTDGESMSNLKMQ